MHEASNDAPTPAEKQAALDRAEAQYRATHGRDGGVLGVHYPDNRVGRRAMARTWKRASR